MYSFSVWYNLHCKTGKGGKIVLIETTIYKCEYCGAKFDDEYEADCHEWVCRYKDVRKQDGSRLKFYKEDGSEIKFDNAKFVWDDFDDVEAFTIGNDSDVKFIADFFEWHDYDNPFCAIADEANQNYYGLWYFDPDLSCYGQWVRVDDQIKKWTDIKNKFEKGA